MGRMLFYAHAGSGNHGCEAIVRASEGILGEDIVLYSARPDEDRRYGLHTVITDIERDDDSVIRKYSIPWITSRIQTKLTGSIDKAVYYRKRAMIDAAAPGDIAFSIGGDNYCYPGTDILAAQNRLFQKGGAKTVLWGCSVEPELLKKEDVAKDIASYDLIVARESISYEALKAVNHNTILIPDPAFTLERSDAPLPEGWINDKMVGINASPLILQAAKDGALILDAYKELIRHILEITDYSIVLIPHVVWENNDDRKPLEELYNTFKETGRVILLKDHNCMELKGYIARCQMFIGARTHATIAAYSSCVPTLVLGYSVKSRGIAKDLFGTEKNYVLSAQGLNSSNELKERFIWLMESETYIRQHLQKIMPEYINRIHLARDAVKQL